MGGIVGCGGGPPDAESLRQAFADQVASVPMVSDLQRDGDELTFVGPGKDGAQSAWLVNIDSAVVEPYEDEQTPYRGVVLSSWYDNGEPVEPVGTMSGLPSAFLDQGMAQDCWGLWDAADGRWTW